MTLNFRYVLGLTDIIKENTGPAQKHGAFQFLVGIPIGRGKANPKVGEVEIVPEEVDEENQ